MECADLTDAELWRAIAENTNVMSALIYEQLEMDAGIAANDPAMRAELMRCHLQTINKFQREYRDYTTELRRRYKTGEAGRQRIAEQSTKRILSNASVNEIFGSPD